MPKHAIIRVAPGDFNKKYILIQEEGARNRTLNPQKLRNIVENWDEAHKDTVTLIQVEDKYLIADGQHRIAAASTYFQRPVTLNAMIWDDDEVEDYADFIRAFNQGTPFSTLNMLEVYQDRSEWPIIFQKAGIEVHFKRFTGTALSWSSIMRGVIMADAWREAETFNAGHGRLTRKVILNDIWLGYHPEGIREVAEAIKWWQPAAAAAYRRPERVGQLHSDIGIATALTVYRKYKRKPGKLRQARDRIIRSENLGSLKGIHQSQAKALVRAILGIMNHKVRRDFIIIAGENGRD
jgi:hypothetical protein